MNSLDAKGRSLEEVIDELLTIDPNSENKEKRRMDEPLKDKSPSFLAKIKIQRLKGELRKYVTRPEIYSEQINYIKRKVDEIEEEFPDIKVKTSLM